MATEILELEHYPIWEQQPGEPDDKFLLFEKYFLALPKANLLGAVKRYRADKGENSQINNVPGNWRDFAEQYRWRERHTAFWRWKNQSDREWREEKIRQNNAQLLDTAELLRDRAMGALSQIDVEDIGAKDIAALLRLSQELTENALNLGDLNKAVAKVLAAGYEVLEGGENEVVG